MLYFCVFKSNNSCFKCLDILCGWHVHTPIQQTYSVLCLAIQLSYLLVLLFYIYIAYVKHSLLQINLDSVRMTLQIICEKAVPAHYFLMLFFCCCFSSATLQGSICIRLLQFKHMPFTYHQRYGHLPSPSFHYLIQSLLVYGGFSYVLPLNSKLSDFPNQAMKEKVYIEFLLHNSEHIL